MIGTTTGQESAATYTSNNPIEQEVGETHSTTQQKDDDANSSVSAVEGDTRDWGRDQGDGAMMAQQDGLDKSVSAVGFRQDLGTTVVEQSGNQAPASANNTCGGPAAKTRNGEKRITSSLSAASNHRVKTRQRTTSIAATHQAANHLSILSGTRATGSGFFKECCFTQRQRIIRIFQMRSVTNSEQMGYVPVFGRHDKLEQLIKAVNKFQQLHH
mmetsp:Transcript_14138/g.39082  ORF Transcript_14138/g.39082 Transcript_14138/m.39082 type:complete len:214 (+) Transcript_14138:150-791(+)